MHSKEQRESFWQRSRNIQVHGNTAWVSVRWLSPFQSSEQFCTRHLKSLLCCPLTELVRNKYAVSSRTDLQHANSPNLGWYYLRILDILSKFRQTHDLEYENTSELKLHLQLASYARDIMMRKADIFLQAIQFVNEEPKHWNRIWLCYIQWIWLPVLYIYTNRKFQ